METSLGAYRINVLLFLLALIFIEVIWSIKLKKNVYSLKSTMTNFYVLIGFFFFKTLFTGYQLALLSFVSKYKLINVSESIPTFIMCFLLADFIYYWFHRVSHTWKPLWAFHLIHHSSQEMNLTAAYRLNWMSALISPIFFIPLVLLGFSPDFIVISYTLNLLYQFFLHTEIVGKLGFLEKIIDTPSSHRVHHGSNPIYIDKNFGGVFIIWDLLFKTYQPEVEKVKYGITTGFISNNPLVLNFKGFWDLFNGKMKYKG
ncbi:sterol desaturase family protein [Flavobacterium sp.]|uniref:sterol desaturase family protein n=1 Tax=Flavobacterium sp. TaxID=239 RepID=UPI00286EB263|nr:sterol desaturase family protein [Flavobacterium sp.]